MTHTHDSLPCDEDAEKGMLCCLALNSSLFDEAGLSSELFYIPANRIIFERMLDVYQQDSGTNFITLKAELVKTGQLEEVGGKEYLSEIWDWNRISGSAFWGHYRNLLTEQYSRRVGILECWELVEKLYDPGSRATAENIRETLERTLTRLAIQVAPRQKTFPELVEETLQEIEEQSQRGSVNGIRFGLETLDEEIDGIQPGELCVISGKTSSGKSALALQAVLCAAASGQGAAHFSLEMPGTQTVKRVFAADGQITMKSLRRSGLFSRSEWERLHASANRIKAYPIHIEDNTACDINQIVSRCRLLKTKHGIGLVVVDYLQLVQPARLRREETREREVADISRKLKALAIELGLSVLALSQLNDAGLLRESRAIGQNADIVLKLDESKSENSNALDIVIEKHRSGAHGKRVTVEFYGQYMQFRDKTPPAGDP
jgi:replicative DNA helicase